MRTEQVEIEPVNLCGACPKRESCVGVARLAIDTYIKASFFTWSVPEGDPDEFMYREYVDNDGGKSHIFLVQGEELINACEGPKRVRSKRFGRKFLACGAHTVVVKLAHDYSKLADEQWRKDRESAVYLTPEELDALGELNPLEAKQLADLPNQALNELVLFGREHPKQVAALKQMAAGSAEKK